MYKRQEESRADAQREKVVEIPLSELHPFNGHPFKVKADEAMMETADSIKQYGVLVPAIARPDPEGGYEPVSYTHLSPQYNILATFTKKIAVFVYMLYC